MKSKLLFFTLLLTALLFSACTMKFTTNINSDGSGEFIVEYEITENDIEYLEDEFYDEFEDFLDGNNREGYLEDTCNRFAEADDSQEVVFNERDGSFTCKIIFPFQDMDGLSAQYENVLVQTVTYDRIQMRDGALDYELELWFGGSDDFDYFEDIEITWELTVPGKVVNENADEQSGRTLTWELYIHD